jgi:hypothetical protein
MHTDGIRSIDSTLSLRFAREDAKEFIDKIRELTSLINQADGESKPTLWMVPEDFLIVGSEKPFDYPGILSQDNLHSVIENVVQRKEKRSSVLQQLQELKASEEKSKKKNTKAQDETSL